MAKVRFLILGSGPTGLGAAHRLRELGETDFLVVESSAHVGGLSASFKDEKGFTWDIGGHVQFSHYKYFDELMVKALGDRWRNHQRESWVWIEDRFVPYPFQNNIRHLKPETCWKCIKGLVQLYKERSENKPRHFGDWIDATFGAGLAEVFMRPYNFKVWAYPAEEMDYSWVGERVAVTDLERLLDNILHGKDDISWGPNNTFQFPIQGGTGAIWEAVADLVGRKYFRMNTPIETIDLARKVARTSGGDEIVYDHLISSIPIDRLVDCAGLNDLKAHANLLKYSSSNIIGVGLAGKPPSSLATKGWMYFPEDNCPFYRVTVFSNYSTNNVPDITRHWSLMAEVSESPPKPVNHETLVNDVIEGMRATQLIGGEHDVVSTWKYRAKYGYPTPSVQRDRALNAIHSVLEKESVFSRGRFGGWKYEVSNQDHSCMQGVEIVNRLLLNVPEVTYPFPNTANNLKYAKGW